MLTRLSLIGSSVASLFLLASASAQAADPPFIKTNFATCESSNVCTVKFGAVPDGHRLDVSNVACRNNLLNPDTSRELVDLVVPGNNTVTYPLLPVNVTNSNIWIVSQEVSVPVIAGKHVEIHLQSFGGAVVGGAFLCTISGQNVTVP